MQEKQEYSVEQVQETYKYLDSLKFSNRKQYNKFKKQGRKFSDTIMSRLK